MPTHDDDPGVVLSHDLPRARRRTPWVLGVLWVLGVAALVSVVAFWHAGDDDPEVVVAPPADARGPAAPATPGPLTVSVDAPTTVLAGAEAAFVVRYRDGEGIFSGSTEDWGDTGAGSASQVRCSGDAPAAGPLEDGYIARHAWTDPGSYPVRIDVTTYVCRGGESVEETATATLQVTVR
jgi:hypothetical protein